MSYVEVLGDKSTMHIRVTLYLMVLDCIVTILFGVCLAVAYPGISAHQLKSNHQAVRHKSVKYAYVHLI